MNPLVPTSTLQVVDFAHNKYGGDCSLLAADHLPANQASFCSCRCAVQVARLAHDKFGGEEQLQEHQRARADAKLQSKLRVRCSCCACCAVYDMLCCV